MEIIKLTKSKREQKKVSKALRETQANWFVLNFSSVLIYKYIFLKINNVIEIYKNGNISCSELFLLELMMQINILIAHLIKFDFEMCYLLKEYLLLLFLFSNLFS